MTHHNRGAGTPVHVDTFELLHRLDALIDAMNSVEAVARLHGTERSHLLRQDAVKTSDVFRSWQISTELLNTSVAASRDAMARLRPAIIGLVDFVDSFPTE